MSSSYDDEEPRFARRPPHGLLLGRSGSEQICDGAHARQITFVPADCMGVAWSPRLARTHHLHWQDRKGDRVYRASLLGAPRLTLLLREARATDLSRDGRWLYVSRTTVQPKKLADRLVPVTDGPAEFARESVDGRSIYFSLRQESDGLWQQPVSGGPPRQVVDQLYRRNLFVPARDGVYYIARPPADSFPSLYFRNAATGRTTRLKAFDHDIFWGLDLAPDERSLVYSQFDVANSDIMLVSDFR